MTVLFNLRLFPVALAAVFSTALVSCATVSSPGKSAQDSQGNHVTVYQGGRAYSIQEFTQLRDKQYSERQAMLKNQYPDGSLKDGIAAEEARQWDVAGAALRPLAERGDPQAQTYLAITMMKCACTAGLPYGQGPTTQEWFERAAAQEYLPAQLQLGMFWEGWGKYENAMKWYRAAADHGSSDALVHIGMLYESGKGVPKDPGKAEAFYDQALNKGNGDAQQHIAPFREAQEQERQRIESEKEAGRQAAEEAAFLKTPAGQAQCRANCQDALQRCNSSVFSNGLSSAMILGRRPLYEPNCSLSSSICLSHC